MVSWSPGKAGRPTAAIQHTPCQGPPAVVIFWRSVPKACGSPSRPFVAAARPDLDAPRPSLNCCDLLGHFWHLLDYLWLLFPDQLRSCPSSRKNAKMAKPNVYSQPRAPPYLGSRGNTPTPHHKQPHRKPALTITIESAAVPCSVGGTQHHQRLKAISRTAVFWRLRKYPDTAKSLTESQH